MPEKSCDRSFDEALLTGYVDQALTQSDEQRVRVHLEQCPKCRTQVRDMKQLRETTMGSTFETPRDDQWSEAPRTGASWTFSRIGWMLVILWAVGVAGYALWEVWIRPTLWAGSLDEPLGRKLAVFSGVLGFGLLFASVLLDRLKSFKTDRYREVRK